MTKSLGTHPNHLFERKVTFQNKDKWPLHGRIIRVFGNNGTTLISIKENDTGHTHVLTLPHSLPVLTQGPDCYIHMVLPDERFVSIHSAAASE